MIQEDRERLNYLVELLSIVFPCEILYYTPDPKQVYQHVKLRIFSRNDPLDTPSRYVDVIVTLFHKPLLLNHARDIVSYVWPILVEELNPQLTVSLEE